MSQFELLAMEVNKINMTRDERNVLLASIKEGGLSSLNNCNNHHENSLNTEECIALVTPKKRNDLVIQKSEKGNNIAIIPRYKSYERHSC